MPLQNNIGLFTHFKIFLTTFAICWLAWAFINPAAGIKCSIVYLILWGAVECLHWIKMRSLAVCQVCNFDPILYRQDWRKARRIVEDHLNKAMEETKQKRVEHYARLNAKTQSVHALISPPTGTQALDPAKLAAKAPQEHAD